MLQYQILGFKQDIKNINFIIVRINFDLVSKNIFFVQKIICLKLNGGIPYKYLILS